ncbi:myozenin-2-like [Corythoichthys intestinalis]|uniref:myozenin-2-like n=1 Tax=Corythoichthys intestinalis TaxID=161448 RepID=UPI0025A5EFCD|nr:myozenin-2-like [Corythoichthys intestinalis]XP_057711105.1 myozenin-2-like [Corythoichthys intestinalis]XP_061810791.1 myozenin-2-like [Nerophis lumbriciformis]
MSLFSTMTTGERKLQAAAICREIQGLEDVEMDLGKKVSVPQDIMLEELSLESNRGSRLFKMRQERSRKYTFENVLNDRNTQLNNTTDSPADKGNSTEDRNSADNAVGVHQACTTETVTETVPDPHSIAPGYGGPLKDVPPEKFNSTAIPKSYHSPWDRALIRDLTQDDTLISCVSEPEPPADLPGYKSFNRVAIPFGGFSKAPVKTPKAEFVVPDYPDLRGGASACRPSFNRAALGWQAEGAPVPVPVPVVSQEATIPPESDDL